MKIGIITFQRADNYGALLQCYALYKCMKKMNKDGEVEVIDYRNPIIERRYIGLPNFRLNIFGWLKSAYERKKNHKSIEKKHETFQRLRRLITFSKSYTRREIQKNGLDYDMIITGSDQVWNPGITKGVNPIYYLDFPGDFYRCAYAVSLGNSEQPVFRTRRFLERMHKFQSISLREKKASETIAQIVGKEIACCVDPTFLLEKKEWSELIENVPQMVEGPYVLLYHLDNNPELVEIAKHIAKERNIQVVCCNEKAGDDASITWMKDMGPLEFLKLVEGAQAVVASSFHATAFSAIFEKEVYLTCHPITGERVRSLAEICGISKRVYSSYEDFVGRYDKDDMIAIDKEMMESHRSYSLEFLQKAYQEAMQK